VEEVDEPTEEKQSRLSELLKYITCVDHEETEHKLTHRHPFVVSELMSIGN
jgi:hypothetical protein